MAFLSSLDISGSGLTAGRLRMDVISENIANADATTDAGTPYRRKVVTYQSADTASSFRSQLENELSSSNLKGVQVTGIEEDQTPFSEKYDPTDPNADANGYVQTSNVDVVQETVDMMAASRAYSANLTVLQTVKDMASQALKVGE